MTLSTDADHSSYLPSGAAAAPHLRLDVAKLLKRFHFVERSLIKVQAGWLPNIVDFDAKMALPHMFWQDAMVADACRERVFELRYPSRLMEVGEDASLVAVADASLDAPNALALVRALGEVFKPALCGAYESYLAVADELADGPSIRFLQTAVRDKVAQIERLGTLAAAMALGHSEDEIAAADRWVLTLSAALKAVGGVGLEAPRPAPMGELPDRTPFEIAEDPGRDARFAATRFYWPDAIDPSFPYGEGIMLQLRSAVSHLNEIWAVESAGYILYAFSDELGWEYTFDAARWTYDEARHTRMGYERLHRWGFDDAEMPLGSYIYDSAKGEPPVVRLAMLHHFETKNIGKKTERAEAFSSYADSLSQRDMEFDWADETLHAHYGHRWLKALHERDPERIPGLDELGRRCENLVAATVAGANDDDRMRSRAVASAMIDKARRLVANGLRDERR